MKHPQLLPVTLRSALLEFFVSALADTSAARPREAEYVVEAFLKLIQECHPRAEVVCQVARSSSDWIEGLAVWIDDGSGRAHFYLDWSVS